MELVKKILTAFEAKWYVAFKNDTKDFNLNLCGIRSLPGKSNAFDDKMVVFWWYKGELFVKEFTITTDPGSYYLKKPIQSEGTGILAEGQYRGVFQIGLHQGKMKALVQRGNLTAIRDNDRDDVVDYVGGKVFTGNWFGCNIHGTKAGFNALRVDNWSAMCQVFANWVEFQDFMNLCENAAKIYGNSFTYTLINTNDLLLTPEQPA